MPRCRSAALDFSTLRAAQTLTTRHTHFTCASGFRRAQRCVQALLSDWGFCERHGDRRSGSGTADEMAAASPTTGMPHLSALITRRWWADGRKDDDLTRRAARRPCTRTGITRCHVFQYVQLRGPTENLLETQGRRDPSTDADLRRRAVPDTCGESKRQTAAAKRRAAQPCADCGACDRLPGWRLGLRPWTPLRDPPHDC